MATSFTPGLRVAETTLITKDRILPLRGNVTVKIGEHLAAEQVVASTNLPGNVIPLNAANLLGILPGDVRGALLVKEGDKIEKDQIIAESKSFFGLFKNKLKSPLTGSLESVSDVTGQLILRDPPIPVEIESYIEGRVTKIFPQEGVEVQAVGTFIRAFLVSAAKRLARFA
jgi:Na+-translocating ferredoxin:NAD+ oxidoreductase RnfC subunit